MRWQVWSFLMMTLVSPAAAQGVIVPRPCERCIQPCDPGPCRWVAPSVVRTSSAVHVTLGDGVLQYEIDETWVNRGAGLGEADYYFPLPNGAAFEDLRLSVDGQLLSGEVMDATAARGVYEEIVRRRRDPALVEWMGHGLLHARIFPLAAGEEKRVVVRYQMVAVREGDALRVDYHGGAVPPSVLASAQAPRDGDRDSSGEQSFTLSYSSGAGYGAPYSPTHALVVHDAGASRSVEVHGASRDVTILLPLPRATEPGISVLTHADGTDDGFVLITVAPPAQRALAMPRDLTLVLDVSGSMSGRKLEQARAAARAVLATLGARDRFRLIDFSTDVRTFRDAYARATPANVAAAGAYVDSLEANGSTNIAGALQAALDDRDTASRTASDIDDARVGVVLFITDGAPTIGERDPDVLARFAAAHRGAARVFTFGIGADVNTTLLEQLALDGRGTASFVRPDEDIERAVSVVAMRLRDPVIADVRVRAEGVRLSRVLPETPADLFAGQNLVLVGRYSGSGRAHFVVDGRTRTGAIRWTHDVELPARRRENAFIPRLWAVQRIGWLTAARHHDGPSPELDAELRSLGERYGIPTELTSYLVREPMLVANGPRGLPMVAAQSLAAPEARFEAAKAATAMRDTRSLAYADSIASDGASDVRRVGDRVFVRRDSVWTDARFRPGMRVVRIQPYGAGYFQVLGLLPEVRASLALGERVLVAGRTIAVEIGPAGTAELTPDDAAALRAEW